MKGIKRETRAVLAVIAFFVILGAVLWSELKPAVAPKPLSGEGLEVRFLDVGQGDAVLAQCGGQVMLVDAGDISSADTLPGLLSDMGVTKIDILVGTHPHADHIGGMAEVIRAFDIGVVILPDQRTNTKTFEDLLDALDEKDLAVTRPKPGDRYALGDAQIHVLGPVRGNYAEMNDNSVILRINYGDTAFLLTGDAEKTAEMDLLSSGADLSADVLKIGHHGSDTSTSGAFLDAVSPRYAVISVGAGNAYGHPSEKILAALAEYGVVVFRTDWSGTVVCLSDGAEIVVSTEYERSDGIEDDGEDK